ncbi:mRNA 3'-end-processing protein rna14 [Coemansia sp. RSA 2705]|nr:mRNA 3'-end-processing protein rna14 [Coemansia sp. RSA 2705]
MADSGGAAGLEQQNGLLHSGQQSTGNAEADMYKKRLERSPHDAEAWLGLLRVARASGNDELLYAAYSSALAQYPGSGHLLATFVDLELSRGNKSSAETIFNSNLFNVPSLELWQSYLNYVLQANVEAGVEVPPENRATLMDCFRLVLDNVGFDRGAGQIWIDYINFINSAQSHAQYDEQQKVELLRETYQTAVAIPVLRVEDIWKEYDAFEAQIDRKGAKQQLGKMSPAYMTARTALREMNRFWDAIQGTRPRHGLPQPPGWTAREVEHLDAWKRYLKWELGNPLRLSGTEAHKRVIYAYSQACMDLWLYPEIWIEFAEYYASIGQQNEALAKLQAASGVLPQSLAVQFAYAETAEKMKQLDVCKQVYEGVIDRQRSSIEKATEKYTRKLDRQDRRVERAAGSGKQPDSGGAEEQPDSDSDAGDGDDVDDSVSVASDSDGGESKQRRTAQQVARVRKAVERRKDAIRARMADELAERRETYTLTWIMYLRYMQRSEGIGAVQQLLKRSRTEPAGYMTHHFYVAAAHMEYHIGKRPGVAAKLFELYVRNFSDTPEYIAEYLNYLVSSGDDTNARALFERFHGTAAGDSSELWAMFADFEYNYGDLSAIEKLDRRLIEKFDHESMLTRMATRYSYLNVDCVAVSEFGFPYRKDAPHEPRAARGLGVREPPPADVGGLRVRADSDAGSEPPPHVAVGSVTGRTLNRHQLLASAGSGRFAKPALGSLQAYAPVVEPFVPLEPPVPPMSSGSDYRSHSLHSSGAQFRPLLEQGDVLSYVAAAVAAPDTSAFDALPLNIDALLGAVMHQAPAGGAPSNYRPLSYMPWASRSDSQPHPHAAYPHRGGRPYTARSRSRGRYGDDGGHRGGYAHPARHAPRGGHRQSPYSRSPGYSADGRQQSRGPGPRYHDRPAYHGRP